MKTKALRGGALVALSVMFALPLESRGSILLCYIIRGNEDLFVECEWPSGGAQKRGITRHGRKRAARYSLSARN